MLEYLCAQRKVALKASGEILVQDANNPHESVVQDHLCAIIPVPLDTKHDRYFQILESNYPDCQFTCRS